MSASIGLIPPPDCLTLLLLRQPAGDVVAARHDRVLLDTEADRSVSDTIPSTDPRRVVCAERRFR
ncbi:hypothetical protein [Pseudomonas duriflava]|uniref:hypothetical protein n=1 Tax=Pseudomonas duriflava TaxID=459528 RepID=UPI0011A35552|nr:hypothetical protein [Pseudomonas duriflava]